ncbi:unnamed protein product, partial [Tetraodon nigroviridis]
LQFSKDKYLLESPPEKLRKELEEELKLSAADIRSHGWYHGHIPREVSETLVLRNGDFLVRDSLTSVGDFVLTCRWDNEALHFRISKVLVKSSETKARIPGYSRVFQASPLRRGAFRDADVAVLLRCSTCWRPTPSTRSRSWCGSTWASVKPSPSPTASTSTVRSAGRWPCATWRPPSPWPAASRSAYSPSSPRGAHIKRRSVTMTDGLT